MRAQRQDLVLWLTLTAAMATLPSSGKQLRRPPAARTAAIPDFSGVWRHPSLPGFEPPASGPGPVTNRSRRNGVSNWDQLVGDYTNPILQAQGGGDRASQHGEISLKPA